LNKNVWERIENAEAVVEESYRLIDPMAACERIKISEVKAGRLFLENGNSFESELFADKFSVHLR
jgi:hypothetical protein